MLAFAVFVVTVFLRDAPGDALAIRPIGDVPIVPLLGFVAGGGALYWRRRFPLVVLAVVLVAWAMALVGADKNMSGIAAIFALYGTDRYAAWDQRGRMGAATGYDQRRDPRPLRARLHPGPVNANAVVPSGSQIFPLSHQ